MSLKAPHLGHNLVKVTFHFQSRPAKVAQTRKTQFELWEGEYLNLTNIGAFPESWGVQATAKFYNFTISIPQPS